jgi:predicted small integral membrane protein
MSATATEQQVLPGFRVICSIVGGAYVLLGGSMVLRGARAAMQPFGVPELVLSSPHFTDFFHWVFVHMMVLGILIGMLGQWVRHGPHQQAAARVLCLIELHYTYLDLRTSDSALGSGLYQGPQSLVPPAIDVIVVLLFAYLGVRRLETPRT